MASQSSFNRGSAPTKQPAVIQPGRPTLRTTFQLAADILPAAGEVAKAFDQSTKVILQWVRSKFPTELPQQGWKGESFDVEEWGQKVECIAIAEAGLWSLRLTQPDAPFGARAAVPGRIWTTDIAVSKRPDSIGFGIRVICASLPYCNEEIALTRPRVVLDLIAAVGLHEIRLLDGRPWQLASDQELVAFQDFLTDPLRTMPVFLLTQPDRRRFQVQVSDWMLDADHLARKTQGFAHVVLLPWQLGYQWTEMVGKPWSAYLGAVRTYQPGLDFELDSPDMHPRAIAERILFFRYNALEGEKAFTAFLIDQAAAQAASKRVHWNDRLFITDARTKQTELVRQQAKDDSDWRKLYEDEIASLKIKVEEATREAEEYNNDAIQAMRDREAYAEENAKLRAHIESLRARLAEKMGEEPDLSIPIPNKYDDLREWVDTHLAGRLLLHPRALKGLKTADYEDPSLVYRSLLLLANEYRNMRMGIPEARKAYEEGLNRLGVRHDGSITRERAGEQGDTYFVVYPLGSGQKQFVEFHLRKGSNKDTRYCLAIYFFWDENTQQVVVAWMPSHLDNRMT
ncbi:MAG: hypothetical protein HRF43_19585 [Phycisphaerae bacterium]|jgi:hypothetical protein